MKNIYEVWLPKRNSPTIRVKYRNSGRKYTWSSRNKILENLTNKKQLGRKKFSEVFTKSERKFIKSKFRVPQNYENALKSIINLENNTKRTYNVVRNNKMVSLYYKPNVTRQTFVKTNTRDPFSLYISYGITRKNLRNKGIGKQMRALITLAAKKAGFKKVTQNSKFIENANRRTHEKPPSSYVMTKLGFNQIPGNNMYHHKYVFNNKPNNSLLVKYAYPLKV